MEREKWNMGKLQAAGDGAREVEYRKTSGSRRWSESSGIWGNFRQREMEREKWNTGKLQAAGDGAREVEYGKTLDSRRCSD